MIAGFVRHKLMENNEIANNGGIMNVNRTVRLIAGLFVLGSLALAHFVNPNWLWFTAFVGLNLFQSALTNWCLMDKILIKLGVPE